ncbi:MAG: hypothetical protein O3C05_02520, partial [Proteobacteria bacterium]|nr:hypothetical protein [Pseudomonadota bacterium]
MTEEKNKKRNTLGLSRGILNKPSVIKTHNDVTQGNKIKHASKNHRASKRGSTVLIVNRDIEKQSISNNDFGDLTDIERRNRIGALKRREGEIKRNESQNNESQNKLDAPQIIKEASIPAENHITAIASEVNKNPPQHNKTAE